MLYPDSFSLLEQWNQLSFDMKAHHLIGTSDHFLVDEHHRKVLPSPCFRHQGPLQLRPVGQFIEFINRMICSKATYQWLNGVRHATSALAEYDHRFVRRQLLDRLHVCGGTLVFVSENDLWSRLDMYASDTINIFWVLEI